MRIDAPVTHGGLELGPGDVLLGRLFIVRVVEEDARAQDVELAWREIGQLEEGVGPRRSAGEEASKDHGHEDREDAFKDEEPLPAGEPGDPAHLETGNVS